MPTRRPFHLLPFAPLVLTLLTGACGRSTPKIEVTTAPPNPGSPVAAGVPSSDGAPRVVQLAPPNGSTDVDPQRQTLSVTFDRTMDREGWSWVIEGPESAPELGEATFDASGRTNTVQATLRPGRTYVLWINSPKFSYFRSPEGIPAQPVRWTFTTGSGSPGSSPARAAEPLGTPAVSPDPPRVIRLEPPNGAIDVDPGTPVLRATFDRPMEASWSWVKEGSGFPEATGPAYFETDARTASLPVRLQPGQTYVVWLNSDQYLLFRDAAGNPAVPVRWVFFTRAAP